MSTLLLIGLGTEEGIDEADLLAGTGITPGALLGPQAEVSARQELGVVANLVDALGDPPGLGFDAGARYHLTAYGLWSFLLISSPTPRSAVEVALRYLDLTFTFCRIAARERDGELQFVIDAPDVPPRLRRFLIEREAAAIRTIEREAFAGSLRIRRVTFPFGDPGTVDGGAAVLGVRPAYDAAECIVAYDAALLDEAMPQANEHAAALARAQCTELLQRRRARAGLAGQVRDLLVARLADPPDAAEVAAALHLGNRTLQRRLADEGTSFRALLDEVREQLAEELLVTGGLPVAEVAERLGYVEVSSFSQAFRRWKGMGPRAYRRA